MQETKTLSIKLFFNTKLSSEMLKVCEEGTGENMTYVLKNHQMVKKKK